MDRPVCEATRNDGLPCRAPALPGRPACWAHDPAQAEAAREARARGAAKSNVTRALRAKQPRYDSPRELVKFVGLILSGTLVGKIAPDVARVVLYGVSIQRQLLESSSLESRLVELERLLAQRRLQA
jgi:hypothetical protein